MKHHNFLPAALAVLLVSLPACAGDPPQGQVVPSGMKSTCRDCGTVSDIETLQDKRKTSGGGAVAGAVLGAVIGHQFGSGRGQDAATAAGAVGGAVAGNEMEKRRQQPTAGGYRITVRMDGGDSRKFDVPALNGLASGARVRVTGNNLEML